MTGLNGARRRDSYYPNCRPSQFHRNRSPVSPLGARFYCCTFEIAIGVFHPSLEREPRTATPSFSFQTWAMCFNSQRFSAISSALRPLSPALAQQSTAPPKLCSPTSLPILQNMRSYSFCSDYGGAWQKAKPVSERLSLERESINGSFPSRQQYLRELTCEFGAGP